MMQRALNSRNELALLGPKRKNVLTLFIDRQVWRVPHSRGSVLYTQVAYECFAFCERMYCLIAKRTRDEIE